MLCAAGHGPAHEARRCGLNCWPAGNLQSFARAMAKHMRFVGRLSLQLCAALALACAIDDRAAAEKLTIPSSTSTSYLFMTAPDPSAVPAQVPANLELPAAKKDRYPTVVIGHTIGGWYGPNEDWFAAELRKAGFATFTFDSFSPRKFGDVTHGNEPRTNPAVFSDAYAALKLLAAHPKVDAKKIAYVGFSLGGEVAHVMAFERSRAVNAPDAKYAAHVSFYPAWIFGTAAGAKAYTGAPVLLLLAEKDELTPPSKVNPYLAYHEKGGSKAPIEVVTYAGAYHSWTNPRMPQPKFFPKHGNAHKCPMMLLGGGPPRLLIDGTEKPFDRPLMDKCRVASAGYTQGFNAQVRAKSLSDTVAFLNKHLWQ
jgi:dienelactone hydrolase